MSKKRSISNRETRRAATNVIGMGMSRVNEQIKLFIKQIVTDSHPDPGSISYRIELKGAYYNIILYNSSTGQAAGKSWSLNTFLDYCSRRKIEFELNKEVRALLLKTEEKYDEVLKWI